MSNQILWLFLGITCIFALDLKMNLMEGIQANSNECQKFINNTVQSAMSGDFRSIPQQSMSNSGKGINDLGDYMVCSNNTDFRYILLQVNLKQGRADIGLCLPAICEQQDLVIYENTTAIMLNRILAPTNTTLIISTQFIDPDLVYPEFDTGAWIVSGIAALVIALNIIGTSTSILINQKTRILNQKGENINSIVEIKLNLPQSSTDDSSQGKESLQERQVYQKHNVVPKWTKFLTCFSFTDNFTKLFIIKEDPENTFVIFNGIRALSIFWVIYAHDYWQRISMASNTADFVTLIQTEGWITLAPSGIFAVDVFFFIGGFLSSVLVIEKLLKMKSIRFSIVPSMWLHRFLRIWPTFAFCLLVYYKLSVYWFGGPLWGYYIQQTNYCDGSFWKNLLFVDNMFSHGTKGMEYCFGWGWYLANDFQIFLITPLLLITYVKRPKLGVNIMISMLMASILASYIISWQKDYHVNLPSVTGSPMPDYQDHFYYKPWIRIPPYLIGLLYGIMYRSYKNGDDSLYTRLAIKLHTSYIYRVFIIDIYKFAIYIIGLTLVLAMVWMIIPVQKDMNAWPKQLQYFYQAFSRVFFVIGLALCITPALVGVKKDPAYIILGHKFWVPIARISFCMYLVQLIVIQFQVFGSTQIDYFQNSHMLFFILTDIFYSMIFGGLLSLLVEVPFMNLEKILFAPPIRPQKFLAYSELK